MGGERNGAGSTPTSQRGRARVKRGRARAPINPAVPARCRAAAPERRSSPIAREVNEKRRVTFRAISNAKRIPEIVVSLISASLRSGLFDQFRKPVELLGRQFGP